MSSRMAVSNSNRSLPKKTFFVRVGVHLYILGFGLISSLVQDKSQIVYVTIFRFPPVGGSRRRTKLIGFGLILVDGSSGHLAVITTRLLSVALPFPLSLAFQRLQLGDSCATTAGTWETEMNGTSACTPCSQCTVIMSVSGVFHCS
jgi:hypothetical protein